jgi:hypothetical protein
MKLCESKNNNHNNRPICLCSVSHQRWPSKGYRQLKTINFLGSTNKVAQTFYDSAQNNDLDYIKRNYARVQVFLKSMNIQVRSN